jgi:hypothetical protein
MFVSSNARWMVKMNLYQLCLFAKGKVSRVLQILFIIQLGVEAPAVIPMYRAEESAFKSSSDSASM